MVGFKFLIDQAVDTPNGRGSICDRYDSSPNNAYRVIMVQESPVIPVSVLTFNESDLLLFDTKNKSSSEI